MRKLIGDFFLGHETVQVFVDTTKMGAKAQEPGDWVHNGKIKTGFMVIGIAESRWSVAVENLLHEAFEYVAAKRNARFEPSLAISPDSSNCLFVFDHAVYTQMIAAVAEFVAQCQPGILSAHQKHHRKRKK